MFWTCKEGPHTVQASPVYIHLQNISHSSTPTVSNFSSTYTHCCLLSDGGQWKRPAGFHGHDWLSWSFVPIMGKKGYWKYVSHPPWVHASLFFSFFSIMWLIWLTNLLTFNILPVQHALWSRKLWGSSWATSLIQWMDQARPTWVYAPFHQVLRRSWGRDSVPFNSTGKLSSVLCSRVGISPYQVSSYWYLSFFLIDF